MIRNKIINGILVGVIGGCLSCTAAFAYNATSVTIYANNSSATSAYIYCTSKIDGFGVNDSTSTDSLYYTLRFRNKYGIDSEAYSKLMKEGTGSMTSSGVQNWHNIFTGKVVLNGPGDYAVKLNPKGALAKGCYGAGKLVD